MKILFVAAEGSPFVKTGGLGDVIGSLPKELRKQGLDVRVVLPMYSAIPSSFKEKMSIVGEFIVALGWRNQPCRIQKLKHHGVTYYFLNNDYYFNREGIYGFYDDAERWAFFCRAALEALTHLDFRPDILHCHDWHTAMISVLLKAQYQANPFYKNMKTVFTIHNMIYQGIFPNKVLSDLLDLGDEYLTSDCLEFYGRVNFLKGALVFSDVLSTVSKTYAEEIQTPFYGEKLDGLLRQRKEQLVGILNGLDYEEYNPATDENLFANYKSSYVKKQKNKEYLQGYLNLKIDRDIPLIAVVSRLVKQKGLDLIGHVLDEILALDIQFVVLGTGEERYEKMFRAAANRYPGKVSANIIFDDTLARKIYAASDLFLMPSLFEPCGISQLMAMRYASIPIVRETGGLKDSVEPYNEITREGNGFSFTNYDASEMLHAIKRAESFYHNKKVWPAIIKNAVKSDFTWNKSAEEYQDLYNDALAD